MLSHLFGKNGVWMNPGVQRSGRSSVGFPRRKFSEAVELWSQRKEQGAWRFVSLRWNREEMLDFLRYM